MDKNTIAGNDIIHAKVENQIALITLNRPERLNAINRATIQAIHKAFDKFESDNEVAVVIIRGSGRAFSPGMDPKDDTVAGVSGKDGWQLEFSRLRRSCF